MRRILGNIAIVSALLLTITCAYAQETAAAIDVRGDILKPRQWTVSDLKGQFAKDIQTIKFSTGTDQPLHTGTGVPLISLLQAATPRIETTPKHYDLSFLVIIEARDGYRVYFSLAELLPACGRAQAWLILDMDGKALPDKEAPVRLAVLSDQEHDRYIWGIAKITLVDGTKLANQLSTSR
jgi:hypothetical protein